MIGYKLIFTKKDYNPFRQIKDGTITDMSIIFKRTKILATLGPQTSNPEMIEKLALAGANGFRLNFSHGNYEERDEQIKWIRQVSQKIDKPIAILHDLQGPKIRLGTLNQNTDVT